MNWVFLDCIGWDYDVATPDARPLAGSQSAMCYLARALARRGEHVTTLTATTRPREVEGVRCLRYENIPAEIFAPSDTIIIVVNGPAEMGRAVRDVVPPGRPLILWSAHTPDDPAVAGLRDPACLASWDRIVCVSYWQKRLYQEHLGLPLDRIDILKSGIAPAFENLFHSAGHLADAKGAELRLAYASAPFRGLAVLLACFPAIHKRHPSCRLDVYSSMQVDNQPAATDPYQKLYEQCSATAGVRYHGSLPQPKLAKELAAVSVLAHPSIVAETSCIAVREALAAGLLVVTSDLGALAETCQDHAVIVPPAGGERSQEQFAIDYARALDQALAELQADAAGSARRRFQQAEAINKACCYDALATEWLAAAAKWLKSP